jgi:hypothetical protein
VKSRTLACITAMTLFAALMTPVHLAAQHTRYKLIDGPSSASFAGLVATTNHGLAREPIFTTFDAPGAATGFGFGTLPSGINPEGVITGIYTTLNGGNLGNRAFLRARDGTITTFSAPSALSQVTYTSINPAGTITGLYVDTGFVFHGFLRARDGTITTYDLPAGSTVTTITPSINPAGAITGTYVDASGTTPGFLRAPDGTFTTFEVPGANGGTLPQSINPKEAITGTYTIVTIEPTFSVVGHGFLRAPDGTIRTFDVPGAVTTIASGINPEGEIAGNYFDGSNVSHGYLRARDGAITTFSAPGAGTGPSQGTFVTSINPKGAITGYYLDASSTIHGFLRSP